MTNFDDNDCQLRLNAEISIFNSEDNIEMSAKSTAYLSSSFKRQEKGFTLSEILVSVAILSFGLIAVSSMQVSSIRGNAFASDVTEAVTWAGDEIEKLVGLSWNDPLLNDTDGDGSVGLDDLGFDNNPATQTDADQSRVIQGKYTVHWNVAEDSLINDTKVIHVIVTWIDHGVQKRVTLRRVIPRIM